MSGGALRVLKWVLGGLAVLLLLVVALLVFVVATPAGARWAIGMGLERSPVPASIETIEGTLRGPLVLEGLLVEQNGLTARVERLEFDWKPLRLLQKRVEVDSLHATGVSVFVPGGWQPPPTEADEAETEADTVSGPPGVPELPVEVVVHDLHVGIDDVTLEGQGGLAASSLRGRGSPEAFEIEADLSGAGGPITAFEATASIAGSPEAYRLGGDLAFTSGDLPPVSGTLATSGSLTELHIEEARLETASGTADVVADVAWYPDVTWSMTAVADGLDIAPFTPDPENWPGEVSFRAESEGRVTEAGPEATVLLSEVGGYVRGQPLSGGLDARVSTDRIVLDTLGLGWGSLSVEAAGSVADELDLAFAIDAPDIGVAVPGGSGAVRAEGSIAGTRDVPRVDAEFDVEALAVAENSVDRASGRLELDLADGAASRVEAGAFGIAAGGQAIDSLTLNGGGSREAHSVALRLHAGPDRLATGVSGGLADAVGASGAAGTSWTGQLDSLVIVSEDAGEWALAAPAGIQASANQAGLEEACLARAGSGAGRVCLGGSWERDGPAAGELTIAALPLDLAQPYLGDDLTIEGTVEGDGQFSVDPNGSLAGEGTLRADGSIEAAVGERVQRFLIGGDGVGFALTPAGFEATLDASLTPETGSGDLHAEGGLALPGYTSTSIALDDQPIEGGIEVRSDDLGFLAAFAEPVSESSGRFELTADVSGTAAEPAVRGAVALADGRFVLPAFGLDLTDVQLEASGDPEGGVDIAGSVRSGEGQLSVEGRTPAEPTAEEPAELRIEGERFLAVGTPEIQVEIAPDLDIGFDGEVIEVRGDVSVPWARIELLEVPPSAVSPSTDVVFLDEEGAELPDVDAQVEVSIGDDVRFDGFGFGSMIEGELRVREQPGQDPTVLGELRFVDGKFASYGQNLDIDPGRVIFSGPVNDAQLEVTALRTASDGTRAGFEVTGPMETPEVILTSDPSMSDADALSYVMYGKAMSDGNASEQGSVAGAVAGLGANVVTTKIANDIGLDEARIEGATKEQAELVTGKYLTPSLYVSYGLGLFEPSNTFRIKYLLSSNWAVQAESGDANGGDLLYQIERGD